MALGRRDFKRNIRAISFVFRLPRCEQGSGYTVCCWLTEKGAESWRKQIAVVQRGR